MRANPGWERSIDVDAPRIIFAGGGTGGHLFPALAIAEEVRLLRPAAEILFVGTRGKIESHVVPSAGYQFETIWISGFRRSLAPGNLLFPLKVAVSLIQSHSILRRFRPDAVVGTGGYVSGPVVYTAAVRGIPTLIHEQNSMPGATSRFLGKKVDEIHCSFRETVRYFHRPGRVFVSGNPTRRELEKAGKTAAEEYFGLGGRSGLTLLVLGGSLGAHSLNQAVTRILPDLVKEGVRIIWQTGQEDYASAASAASAFGPAVSVSSFIERMDYAYAACDLVACRAGATTIAELTRLGKPSILIPYPFAAGDHQTGNARAMADRSAAELVADREVDSRLLPVIRSVVSPGRLEAMGRAARELGNPSAGPEIARHVLHLAGAL